MGGGVRGKEKWRQNRTHTPEGWLGGGEGLPCLEGPPGAQRIRGSTPSISPAQSGPGKPVGLPGWVLYPPRPPLGCSGPRGVGGRQGRRGEVDRRGPPESEDQGRCRGHFPCPLGPREACRAPGPGPPFSGAPSGLVGPRDIGGREEE